MCLLHMTKKGGFLCALFDMEKLCFTLCLKEMDFSIVGKEKNDLDECQKVWAIRFILILSRLMNREILAQKIV